MRTKSSVVLVATALLCVWLTGCFGHAVQSPAQGDGVVRVVRGPMFAWGLVGRQEFAPECTSGVTRTESWMPWWGPAVAFVTLGVVYPWRAAYECALPDSAAAMMGGAAPVVEMGADPNAPPPPDPFQAPAP